MSWTDKDVERWMVNAQKADRRIQNPGQEKPLKWPDLHVANPDHRKALRLWIWCEANGQSFHEVCQERGLSYTTANRHRRAGVERIVMLLNLEQSLSESDNLVA